MVESWKGVPGLSSILDFIFFSEVTLPLFCLSDKVFSLSLHTLQHVQSIFLFPFKGVLSANTCCTSLLSSTYLKHCSKVE